MRGRSLRLDPDDPQKLASNWDVVCVAPDLVRGSADYSRFVRKHLHLYAPADDGEIEAGPSHVHPELSPFSPPPVGRLAELNRTMLVRAAARDEARERWRIGEPYRGADLRTLVARRRTGRRPSGPASRRGGGQAGSDLAARAVGGRRRRRAASRSRRPRARGDRDWPPAWCSLSAAWPGPPCGCGRARERLPVVLPLDSAARSVIDAYRELGELSDAARRLAGDRAARLRLSALRADRGDAGGERPLRDRARRTRRGRRRAALPRHPPAPRSRTPGGDAALARAAAAAAVPGPPPPRAGRPRRPQGPRGGVRARLGAGTSGRPRSCSRSAPTRAAARAPRPRRRMAATRRWCAISGSERACPAPRPRGPGRRGRPRRTRRSASASHSR